MSSSAAEPRGSTKPANDSQEATGSEDLERDSDDGWDEAPEGPSEEASEAGSDEPEEHSDVHAREAGASDEPPLVPSAPPMPGASEPPVAQAPSPVITELERNPDSANVHTRRTMPPPGPTAGDEPAPPSVAARRFPSKQKTLQFMPLSPLDAFAAAGLETPTPAAAQAKPVDEPDDDEPPLVAEIFSNKKSRSSVAVPVELPKPPAAPSAPPKAPEAPPRVPPAARSRNRPVGIATPPARAAVLAAADRAQKPAPGPPPDAPDVVEAALEPHLAWLSEAQRQRFYELLLRGEYGELLRLLRAEREKQPRIVNIGKAMAIVEQAECSRLLHELGATSSEVVVVEAPQVGDDSPRSALLRLARSTATLAELLASSPLPKLRTLQILHDLRDEGALVLRSPARGAAVTGFGRGMLSEDRTASARATVPDLTREELGLGDDAEVEPEWSEGLDLLSRARAEAADRQAGDDAERQDRPTLPFVEALLPAAFGARDAGRTPAVLGAVALTTVREPAPSSGRGDSVPPSSRAGSMRPSTHVDAPAPTSSRPGAPSLRPAPSESVLPPSSSLSVAPPAAAPRAEAPRSLAPPPARAQWLTLPLAIAALVVSTVTLTALVMRPGAAPPQAPADPKPQVVIAQPAPTPAPTPSPTPNPTPAPAPASPATVRLEVEVHPPYTRVYLDDALVGIPLRTSLPRDGARHVLRFEAGGHKPQQREFQADRDATYVIHLEPMPRLAPPTGAAPSPAPDQPYE